MKTLQIFDFKIFCGDWRTCLAECEKRQKIIYWLMLETSPASNQVMFWKTSNRIAWARYVRRAVCYPTVRKTKEVRNI